MSTDFEQKKTKGTEFMAKEAISTQRRKEAKAQRNELLPPAPIFGAPREDFLTLRTRRFSPRNAERDGFVAFAKTFASSALNPVLGIRSRPRRLHCVFALIPRPSFPSFAAVVILFLSLFCRAASPTASLPWKVLRLARPADPRSLDPALFDSNQDGLLNVLLFQALLDITNRTEVINNQTRDWSVSTDQRTYTLHLLPGLKFSNGRPVTAEDHVYSLERFFDLALPSGKGTYVRNIKGGRAFSEGRTNHVSGLRAPTQDTLEIELDEPDLTFKYVLAEDWGKAVARETLARPSADCGPRPVCTGPYVVKDWVRGARIRFEKNPYYFRPERQFFDEIDVMIGGDESTHLMMFERGELDIANITGVGVPVSDFKRLSRDPVWKDRIEQSPAFTLGYLCLNTEIPPLDKVKVRQAIACAVDKGHLQRLSPHLIDSGTGLLNPIIPGYDPSIRGHAHDTDRARQLLREAGYPSGLPGTLELLHDDRQHITRWAQALQADLKSAGIGITLRPVNNSQMGSITGVRRRVSMYIADSNGTLPDPKDWLALSFHSKFISETDSYNDSFYSNPIVDRLLDEAGPCADVTRRFELYHEVERIVLRDALYVPLGHRKLFALRQPWLKGNLIEPIWWYRFDRVWMEP